jgi:hypothetical protein
MNSRIKGLQLLSEKYTRMIESRDERMKGIDALSNEVNLINFFKWLGDVPDKYSTTLDNTLTNYAEGLTDSLAADANILDDDIPDYEPHYDEYQEAMEDGVLHAFRHFAPDIAKIAPGLTQEEALQAIENWEGF